VLAADPLIPGRDQATVLGVLIELILPRHR
jgi:hypothetical protein